MSSERSGTTVIGASANGVVKDRIEFCDGAVSVLRGGEGPALLFLHAAGGAATWHDVYGILARDHNVIVPDHPGFGDSDDLPSVEAMDDLVYHYLDVMDRLDLERPIVVGASFGGWLAAELAVHSPDRISKLVLLSPLGLRLPGHPIPDLFAMAPGELIATLFKEPSAAAGLFPAEPDIDYILRAYRDLGGLARFAWEPFMCNPKLERRLQRAAVPTLVAWPDDDRVVPRAHAERFAELMPNAHFEVIADCGHALFLEQPAAVADTIRTFLNAGNGS